MMNKLVSRVVLFLFFSAFSFQAQAITICAVSCPSNPIDPGEDLPQLVEFYSLGNLDLVLETEGLIFLDESVVDSVFSLTIGAGTTIYASINDVPDEIFIPDVLQLSADSVGFGRGGIEILGLQTEYILMVDFFDTDILNLSSTKGIVLVDAAALTAVPVPAAFWLFVSGASLLLGVSRRRVIS